ncbi:lipopolysaccharide biosynthesis protein [Rhodococcoides kyotonense]|uniref:Membrane protein involved in the export of O-antigen and teichoic acid n=1 Tax=Rhodococcoides kyotonense TaxID=398843 RepID=A0A239MCH7_9NOCA|nr:oligosaccharide flippase family protein [Rhodococcus kyotonensis]SNT40717.1 Membrane protein involved in the export of O-antigen and teichoic acid [Rhodococcus kyotonensis]
MTGRHRKPEEDQPGLDATERRAVVLSTVFRIAGTPIVAVAGLISAGLVIRATGPSTYGVVALVATVGLLLPFADLGIGAVVTSAASRSRDPATDPYALAVIRRSYRVLSAVAGVVAVVAISIMMFDGWGTLIGSRTGPDDRVVITLAVILFGLTIPAGLGLRILIGVDRAPLVVLVMVSNSLFALVLTALMYFSGVQGIWYVLPPLAGALLGNLTGTVVALRVSGLGLAVFDRDPRAVSTTGLLEGSLWLFLVSVGIPFGLQVQRVVLSHLSDPLELSRYALMAQLYGLCWSVFSMAALAFWPIFVKRRGDVTETVRLWLASTMIFGLLAAIASVPLVVVSPWLADVLSGGTIDVSSTLAAAFAVLLIAQCFHLPSGMLLTKPTEARWQAGCLGAMAVVTTAGAIWVAPAHGAAGVVLVTAAAVIACQFIPDIAWIPRIVGRREVVDVKAPVLV